MTFRILSLLRSTMLAILEASLVIMSALAMIWILQAVYGYLARSQEEKWTPNEPYPFSVIETTELPPLPLTQDSSQPTLEEEQNLQNQISSE